MNVLLVSPGYPAEMPHFTHSLAQVGARVVGVGDQPSAALPRMAYRALSRHIHVSNLSDEGAVVDQVLRELRGLRIDRVECLWEPTMILAARIRAALGCPGLSLEQTVAFRDKERMKQVLDAAGIRTPWHRRARTVAEVRQAAEEVGYPLIVKPIDGAGSTDTYRVDDVGQLEAVLPRLRHVKQLSVEEYIDGDEFTFDAICAGGRMLYENISIYRPRPIEEKKHEWVSPSSTCLRDLEAAELRDGREMGYAVLRAMEYGTGFSHMEWYRKADGEVVFGEIGARPPGARLVDTMNFASDVDLFVGWAEAVCHGRISQPIERRYNSAIVAKRAMGQGRIRNVEGLGQLLQDFGEAVVAIEILPIGSPRRDWQRSAVSDGYLILRHPELQTTFRMAERVAAELKIFAS